MSHSALSKEMIGEALRNAEGNVTKAAQLVSVSRKTFYARAKSYGFVPEEYRPKKWWTGLRNPSPLGLRNPDSRVTFPILTGAPIKGDAESNKVLPMKQEVGDDSLEVRTPVRVSPLLRDRLQMARREILRRTGDDWPEAALLDSLANYCWPDWYLTMLPPREESPAKPEPEAPPKRRKKR
jgi:hypothetical protein